MQSETGETGSACARLCVGPAAYFDVKRDALARRQLTWCRAVEVQERKARTAPHCCPWLVRLSLLLPRTAAGASVVAEPAAPSSASRHSAWHGRDDERHGDCDTVRARMREGDGGEQAGVCAKRQELWFVLMWGRSQWRWGRAAWRLMEETARGWVHALFGLGTFCRQMDASMAPETSARPCYWFSPSLYVIVLFCRALTSICARISSGIKSCDGVA